MTTRRHFLVASAAAPLLAQVKLRAANDNIQIAIIGAGGMGSEDVRSSIAAGSKLVAASDIYQGRLTRMREVHGQDIFVTRDYRLFDIQHCVVPTRLPLAEFYRELVETQQVLNR